MHVIIRFIRACTSSIVHPLERGTHSDNFKVVEKIFMTSNFN